ncbi:MAG: aspartoacylase, partial [Kangiellaceae bacterium]|nr:aspartoacylase [Kangiellaceae bacterium]
MDVISNILIVGGTHGNESTGVYIIDSLTNNPQRLAEYPFNVELLLANPEAVKQNKRYLDKDLNRCFSRALLAEQNFSQYESKLAREIVDEIGDKDTCKYDLIIDLHTSTANMGVNLVLTKHDDFHFNMMGYLQSKRDDVVVTSEAEMIPDHHFLCALAKCNVIVEVGPIAQGLLDYNTV